jgi:hypothetical protein
LFWQATPPSLVDERLDGLLISSDEQVLAAAGGTVMKEAAIRAMIARSFIFSPYDRRCTCKRLFMRNVAGGFWSQIFLEILAKAQPAAKGHPYP